MNNERHNTDMELMEICYRRFLCCMTCHACKFVPEHIASDIVQDVFLRLWQKNRGFFLMNDLTSQKQYLYRCISNACHDWIKHNRVTNNHSCSIADVIKNDEIYWYEELIEREDFKLRYDRIIEVTETLPERCREIFELHYLKRMKSAEIAQEMGISIRTVEAQLYKALHTLRAILKENNK